VNGKRLSETVERVDRKGTGKISLGSNASDHEPDVSEVFGLLHQGLSPLPATSSAGEASSSQLGDRKSGSLVESDPRETDFEFGSEELS